MSQVLQPHGVASSPGGAPAGSSQQQPQAGKPPAWKRPAHPPVRIDTCIVGDDSTCDAAQHERCRTELGVSSCLCRPGYSRRKHRDPCHSECEKRVRFIYLFFFIFPTSVRPLVTRTRRRRGRRGDKNNNISLRPNRDLVLGPFVSSLTPLCYRVPDRCSQLTNLPSYHP